MRLIRKVVWGKINSKGELSFYKGELDAFLKMHPNRNVIIDVRVQPIEPSEATKNYYYGYVMPTIRRGFYEKGERFTIERAEEYLRSQCPLMWDEKDKPRLREIDEIGTEEMSEYLEWVKEYAAENLHTIIDDPE